MATGPQIRKIHALKNDLRMPRDVYENLLGAVKDRDGSPVRSSNELSIAQASSLIDSLERVVERTPEVRDRVYASPRQIRLINALWGRFSRARDSAGRRRALDSFLKRRFHVRRSEHLPRRLAPRIIKSLRIMSERERSDR